MKTLIGKPLVDTIAPVSTNEFDAFETADACGKPHQLRRQPLAQKSLWAKNHDDLQTRREILATHHDPNDLSLNGTLTSTAFPM